MPDYRSMYDSQWIKAWDLGGKDFTVTIEKVEPGEVKNRDGKKRIAVLWFRGAKKPFGCNVTNGKTIAAMYGKNTDAWVGKTITLYPTVTSVGGESGVDCIRIKPGIPKGKAVEMPNPEPPASERLPNRYAEKCESGNCGMCTMCLEVGR